MTTTDESIISVEQYEAIYGSGDSSCETNLTSAEMFERQVQALRDNEIDISDRDIKRLRRRIPEQSLRFYLVPPEPDYPYDEMKRVLSLIKVDSKKVTCDFHMGCLRPSIRFRRIPPTTSYLLVDVADGRGDYTKDNPYVSHRQTTRNGRRVFTLWQGLIFTMFFSHALRHHALNFPGSVNGFWWAGSESPITLFWDGYGYLHLKSFKVSQNTKRRDYPNCGTPSAGSIQKPSLFDTLFVW